MTEHRPRTWSTEPASDGTQEVSSVVVVGTEFTEQVASLGKAVCMVRDEHQRHLVPLLETLREMERACKIARGASRRRVR